jgi:hypothetical protein
MIIWGWDAKGAPFCGRCERLSQELYRRVAVTRYKSLVALDNEGSGTSEEAGLQICQKLIHRRKISISPCHPFNSSPESGPQFCGAASSLELMPVL